MTVSAVREAKLRGSIPSAPGLTGDVEVISRDG
jgi:hypothetical protein